MIFVVTGSGDYPFDRLLKLMDALTPLLNEKVILQMGKSKYHPAHAQFFDFVSYFQLMEYYQKAKLIISHTSSGPLIYSKKFNKPIITLPRRKSLGEAVADHQLETAMALKPLNDPRRIVLENESDMHASILHFQSIPAEVPGNSLPLLQELILSIRSACGIQ